MKRKMKLLASLWVLIFLVQTVFAQQKRFNPKQRFHIGVITGLNLSQIDGDRYTGYDKAGLLVGLQGIAVLTRRLDLVTELTFSQKGSRIPYPAALYPRNERLLGVDYAEVPFLLRIKLLHPSSEQKSIELETGFSFARLISSRVEEDITRVRYAYSDLETTFRRNEFNAIVGMHVEVFKEVNLGLRANMSFSKFYVDNETSPLTPLQVLNGVTQPPAFFRNYLLTIYANYQIY